MHVRLTDCDCSVNTVGSCGQNEGFTLDMGRAGWPQTWKNLEYSGNSLNLENSWNTHGILCNLREKL